MVLVTYCGTWCCLLLNDHDDGCNIIGTKVLQTVCMEVLNCIGLQCVVNNIQALSNHNSATTNKIGAELTHLKTSPDLKHDHIKT